MCGRGPGPESGEMGSRRDQAMHPERRKEMEYPLVGVLIEAFRSLLQGLLNLLG